MGSTASATANISAKAITVAASGTNKTYDATVADVVSLSATGVISGDVVSLSNTGASFADKNVGTGKTVNVTGISASGTDSGNYSLTSTTASTTANISAKPITVAAIGSNKTYDSTVADAVTLASSGVISGDVVSLSNTGASFADKNVGTAKTVSVTGISASGTDSGNYSLNNTTAFTSANISAKPITVAAIGSNKTYDASVVDVVSLASSGVLTGDVVNFSNTAASFADKNVGTAKTVSVTGISASGADSGNYSLTSTTASTTANISAKPITVAATGSNKTYDASVADVVNLSVTGVISGDVVSLSNTGANFVDKNVGTAKTVVVSGISASGADAANYSFSSTTSTTASISQATLSVSGLVAANKTWDGTTPATLTGTPKVVALGSDSVSVVGTPIGTFADSLVGTDKAVTVSGNTLSGTDAPNYKLLQQAGLKANIDKVPFTPVTDIFQTMVNPPIVVASVPVVEAPTASPGLNLSAGLAFVDVNALPATSAGGAGDTPSAPIVGISSSTPGYLPVLVISGGIRLPGQTDN